MYTADRPRFTRRSFLAGLGAATALPVLAACAPTSREKELQAELAQAKAERDAAEAKLNQVAKIAQNQPSPAKTVKDAYISPTSKPETPPTPATRFERNVKELKLLWQKDILSLGGFESISIQNQPALYQSQAFPPLAITENAVFLPTRSEDSNSRGIKFPGFDLNTGKELWADKLKFEGMPVAISGDTVWFLSFADRKTQASNFLLPFSTKDGAEKPKVPFVPPLSDFPVLFGDKMFFIRQKDLSLSQHFLTEMDTTTNNMQEKGVITTMGRQVLTTRLVSRNYIIIDYFALDNSSSSQYRAPDRRVVDRNTGSLLSTQQRTGFLGIVNDKGSGGELIPSLFGRRGSTNEEMAVLAALARSGSNLTSKWEIPLQRSEIPMWLSEDMLFLTTWYESRVINPQTGLEIWPNPNSLSLKGPVLGADNNNLYVVGEDGKNGHTQEIEEEREVNGKKTKQKITKIATEVFALRKSDGKIAWRYELGFGDYYQITAGKLLNNELVVGTPKKLVFIDRQGGKQSRPDIELGWQPVNIYSTKRFLVAEGRDKVAVIG